MRVPHITNTNTNPQQPQPLSKPPAVVAFCYEPTSVLDLRSPVSSSSDKPLPPPPHVPDPPPHPPSSEDAPPWDDHDLPTFDWDSIMKDLGLGDDPSNPPPIKPGAVVGPNSLEFGNPLAHNICEQGHLVIPPDFEVYSGQGVPHPLPPPRYYAGGSSGFGEFDSGFKLLEDLIQVSDCIDSNDFQLAQAILARLNQRLRSPVFGKPILRAAFYFK